MKSTPKVSVVTVCYNQEQYIGEALESFVTQKVSFPFEVIVADDRSTDKTPDIIREYAKKYPDIIRPILRTKNVGVQKNNKDALQHARGQYVALCEGDDYWTDPTKLQRQVDFLETHPDYNICFHPVRVFFQNGEEKDTIFPESRKGHHFTLDELLRWNFIQTNAVMYRRRNYDALPENLLPLDWYLHLYHAQGGKIGFIDRVMGAYRRHMGGIWWASHDNVDEIWRKHGVQYFGTYIEVLKLYNTPKHRAILQVAMSDLLDNFIKTDQKYGEHIVKNLVETFPEDTEAFIMRQQQKLQKVEQDLRATQATLEAKAQEVSVWQHMVDQKEEIIQLKNQELQNIKTSKVWRARNKVARVVGKKVV